MFVEHAGREIIRVLDKGKLPHAELLRPLPHDTAPAHVAGTVPSGEVLIDGLGVGDVGNVVLRDRKHLAQDGMRIVVLAVDRDSGTVVSGPDIISRGFVYVREADDLVEGAKEAVRQVLSDYPSIESGEWNAVKSGIRDAVQRYVYTTLKRSPMILPIIMDI